jgi:hypothetical protein
VIKNYKILKIPTQLVEVEKKKKCQSNFALLRRHTAAPNKFLKLSALPAVDFEKT